MSDNPKTKEHDRRGFLKAAASAGLGVPFCLMSGAACGEANPVQNGKVPTLPERDESTPSRVVKARDDGVRTSQGEITLENVRRMLDESVRRLTGEKRALDGWKKLFRPDERVTIKVGCLPGANLSTRPEVAFSVAQALVDVGLNPSNIVVWDRSDRELREAGYQIESGGGRINCYGTDHLRGTGYTRQIYTAGDVGSLFSRILTERSDAVVSVAVLKDHDLSGVSLSMKNFYGVIHNPNKYHEDNCDPYIAQLMTHRQISGKLRLSVIDGMLAQSNRGPAYAPQYAWEWNGLLVSRDPVAVDAVGTLIIEERRAETGLRTLKQAGRPPAHVATAQKLGLGVADEERIEVVEI